MTRTSEIDRMRVGLALLEQDYERAERIVSEMETAAADLRKTIADHRERYAWLKGGAA